MQELTKLDPCVFYHQDRTLATPFVVEFDRQIFNCKYVLKSETNKTLILFHGNGETIDDYKYSLEPPLSELQLNLLFIEYRGYGGSTGRSSFEYLLDDCLGVLESFNIPASKMIIYGRSLGSLPAIHTASLLNPHKLIIDNGIFNMEAWLAPIACQEMIYMGRAFLDPEKLKIELLTFYNNPEKMKKYTGKLLVIHCKHDVDFIPLTHAKELIAASVNCREKKLVELENGDHNTYFRLDREIFLKSITDFIILT